MWREGGGGKGRGTELVFWFVEIIFVEDEGLGEDVAEETG